MITLNSVEVTHIWFVMRYPGPDNFFPENLHRGRNNRRQVYLPGYTNKECLNGFKEQVQCVIEGIGIGIKRTVRLNHAFLKLSRTKVFGHENDMHSIIVFPIPMQ